MHIYGPSQVHGPQQVNGPHAPAPKQATDAARLQQPVDQLDISPAAAAAADAATGGDIRADLVARVRSEIANGTYETPEKLDAALDRFLDASV